MKTRQNKNLFSKCGDFFLSFFVLSFLVYGIAQLISLAEYLLTHMLLNPSSSETRADHWHWTKISPAKSGQTETVVVKSSSRPDYTRLFFLYIRTSNFGAEAERSYIFLQFEVENVLKMFLNLKNIHGIHYMYFSKSMRT